MVRYSIFIAVFLLVIVPSYTQAKAYYGEYDGLDWFNDVGSPATHNGDKCRKDMLIIVDASGSIKKDDINERITPFLVNLIKDPSLNVNPTGTQIALMVFSSTVKMLINFGDVITNESVQDKVKEELVYSKVSGDYTRTDLALQKALTEIFTGHSPGNYRHDVDDLIVLITDGNPRGRTDRKDPQLAKQNATKLKENGVHIISVGVGSDRNKFMGFLKTVATSPKDVVDVSLKDIGTIREKLIGSSCIKSGKLSCKCPVLTTTKYVESDDMKTRVSWPVPEAKCDDKKNKKITMTNAEYPRPSGEFGVGTKTITYSDLSEKTEDTCDVVINVEVCKCLDDGEVKAPPLKPGESKVEVSWKIPRPGCIQKDDNKEKDSALLPYGTTIKKYRYTHGHSKFTCSVKIVVDAIRCGGKKYDPTKNECCCGMVHKKKNNHECCGYQYINIKNKQCCPGFNELSSGSTCPGD